MRQDENSHGSTNTITPAQPRITQRTPKCECEAPSCEISETAKGAILSSILTGGTLSAGATFAINQNNSDMEGRMGALWAFGILVFLSTLAIMRTCYIAKSEKKFFSCQKPAYSQSQRSQPTQTLDV